MFSYNPVFYTFGSTYSVRTHGKQLPKGRMA